MFKGEKVLLRPFQADDVARIYQFAQDAELYGLDSAPPRPTSMDRVRANFESWVKDDPSSVFFAIEADGMYIGDCCLMGLGNPNGTAELGIIIGDRNYWGRGYGRDAVRLLLRYGFHYLGLRRIVLTTQARNERAIRAFTACGFLVEGRPRKAIWVEGDYIDLVNMAILRGEWKDQA